jgi:formylglycine-generating enzyme required for sulfatase activity
MKTVFVILSVAAIVIAGFTSLFSQTVSEEAKRHFDRGVAAVEMAKSPADYEAAIKEFNQAINLAPDWADAYYNLGKVQEQAEKFGDAIASLKEYLRLAPNATNAEAVKSQINKLENKAENTLTKADQGKAGDVVKNKIGMEMVWIPAGSFMMGSTETEVDEALNQCKKEFGDECKREWFAEETPRHSVTISQAFLMGKYEVTQGQWQAVMGTNPSNFRNCGSDCPVERVSWDDAQEFVKKLNARNDGYEYRLPSEAEWEYACRAGTTTAFAYGDTLNSSQANFNGDYPYNSTKGQYLQKTVTVGSYRPNAWGLYDMHGNVWEWVQDISNSNYQGVRADGAANGNVGDSSYRVVRGGGWNYGGNNTRSAYRNRNTPAKRNGNKGLGLRVAARVK